MYKTFPTFAEWLSTEADLVPWQDADAKISKLEEAKQPELDSALKVVQAAAAIDSGAIEGLYETNRGLTFTAATQAAAVKVAENLGFSAKARSMIEAQIKAYEYVVDFVTGKTDIAEAWLRSLHELICAEQETYTVMVMENDQPKKEERPMLLGKYKDMPNHVMKKNGELHYYAEPNDVPTEMERLINELRSPEFESAHPTYQASYAHYSFVVIHPFADGNGRVARALASVFSCRSLRVPLLIFSEDRQRYFDALAKADGGDFTPFIGFCSISAEQAVDLVQQSIDSGSRDQSAIERAFEALFVPGASFGLAEVGKVSHALLTGLVGEFEEVLKDASKKMPGCEYTVKEASFGKMPKIPAGYRVADLDDTRRAIVVTLISPKSARSFEARIFFYVVVPLDIGRQSHFRLLDNKMNVVVEFPFRQVSMRLSQGVLFRLRLIACDFSYRLFDQVVRDATQAYELPLSERIGEDVSTQSDDDAKARDNE